MGRGELNEIVEADEWECLACDHGQIKDLRKVYYNYVQVNFNVYFFVKNKHLIKNLF